MTPEARLWTVAIGIGGGLIAINWNRALARRFFAKRLAGKTDWRGKPITGDVEQMLRYGYVGVGFFFLLNGLWALVRPWLSNSN
jgi:hypothetical protein